MQILNNNYALVCTNFSADVEEYIRMSGGLTGSSGSQENPQLMRIRQHFEKKNKKHSQETDQLQVGVISLFHRLSLSSSSIMYYYLYSCCRRNSSNSNIVSLNWKVEMMYIARRKVSVMLVTDSSELVEYFVNTHFFNFTLLFLTPFLSLLFRLLLLKSIVIQTFLC
jgi:hypothetical protein